MVVLSSIQKEAKTNGGENGAIFVSSRSKKYEMRNNIRFIEIFVSSRSKTYGIRSNFCFIEIRKYDKWSYICFVKY